MNATFSSRQDARVLRFGGVDIGGTKLAVGVTDAEGRVLASRRLPTDLALTPDAVCRQLAAMLDEAALESGSDSLAALGIGCGGPLNRETGTLYTVPNMRGWDGFPLRAWFEERYRLPTALDNDANAQALAEARFGAGRGHSHVCYFTVSTGIGGGFVVNGRLFRGATDLAGEFGHQILLPDGPLCPCGGRGCLEALASGTSMARRARERLRKGAHSSVFTEAEAERVTAKALAEAARQGDPFALSAWEEAGAWLGLGIVNVIHLLNPSVVVLGGGVSQAGDLILAPVRRVVKERGLAPLVSSCAIMAAGIGADVGIVGAAALAKERLECAAA